MTEDGSKSRGKSGLSAVVPILGWLPRYQRTWLRSDLIAGLTVAALVALFLTLWRRGLKRSAGT